MTQPCPKSVGMPTVAALKGYKIEWRKDRTCSYCGSMHPDDVFAAVAAGRKFTPTDKSYKVYVERANPKAGKKTVSATANFDCSDRPGYIKVTFFNQFSLGLDAYQRERAREIRNAGREYWVQPGIEHETDTGKFYFEHFSVDEQKRFIDMLNAKQIVFAEPGYFYSRPFFIAPQERKA